MRLGGLQTCTQDWVLTSCIQRLHGYRHNHTLANSTRSVPSNLLDSAKTWSCLLWTLKGMISSWAAALPTLAKMSRNGTATCPFRTISNTCIGKKRKRRGEERRREERRREECMCNTLISSQNKPAETQEHNCVISNFVLLAGLLHLQFLILCREGFGILSA